MVRSVVRTVPWARPTAVTAVAAGVVTGLGCASPAGAAAMAAGVVTRVYRSGRAANDLYVRDR